MLTPSALLSAAAVGESLPVTAAPAQPAAKRARVDGRPDDAAADATRAAVGLIAEGILALSKLAAKGSAAVGEIGPQLQERASALHRLANVGEENAF